MIKWKKLDTPADENALRSLETGDAVMISGVIYTARDRAHQMISEMTAAGFELPIDLSGHIIYYSGPSPAPPGRVIGSAGPTTSGRMDPFTEMMLKLGVRGMIGKGKRSREVRELFPYYGAVYFSAFGGAGAYLSERIISSRVAAFEELGPEAVYEFIIRDFPVIVINDTTGGDIYEDPQP